MKIILSTLLLASSFSVFATSAKECKGLEGKFTCEFNGQEVVLSVAVNTKTNKIKVDIGGEGDEYIVDEQYHNSTIDDSKNSAFCNQDLLIIYNVFKDDVKSLLSIGTTEDGVTYSLKKFNKRSSEISLHCTKG